VFHKVLPRNFFLTDAESTSKLNFVLSFNGLNHIRCPPFIFSTGLRDADSMNAKIADLMTEKVMSATPHQTVAHVRDVMQSHSVNCMPVVDSDGAPVGIVTSTDVLHAAKDGTPISHIMTEKIYSVPQYSDVSLAARIMVNHRIHHVLVTHEGHLVGIISSFDLLRLVEDHRFVMKNAPDVSARGGQRKKSESV
jgi:CBS domain-containing protein